MAGAIKNYGVTADLGIGLGIGQGDLLAQQQKDETEEIKRRNQQNAALAKVNPASAVASDLGLGVGIAG